jgi:hypothetical protein
MHPMPDTFPDPSDVFDILMKREPGTFKPHPSGISFVCFSSFSPLLRTDPSLPLHRSLLFSYAVLITHSCFNTNLQDPNINDASSYLDLSPVYVRPSFFLLSSTLRSLIFDFDSRRVTTRSR